MKIIILGAGQVGTTLAEHLASEYNDITIIDVDGERLRALQERMDIMTITGQGSYPNILRRGGAEDADLLIAVTSSDETNLVACQIAYTLFQTPTKIARVRSLQYLAHEELFGAATAFPVDVLISPEQLVSDYIRRLIEYPNALQVLDFADERVQLVSVKIRDDRGRLARSSLKNWSHYLPHVEVRVGAIFRQGKSITPTGNTMIEVDDEVFFLTATENVRTVIKELIYTEKPNQRIMIAGGGNIGTRLACSLERTHEVKVIERDRDRVDVLATELKKGIVLMGDASDRELLLSENIQDIDIFCAVTNQDEANIMSSALAKHLGAKKVMALVVRPSYFDIVEGDKIDCVISPQQATIGSLLTHVRRGNLVNVHSLRRGTSEAIEVLVKGKQKHSKVIGHAIKNMMLPTGASIIAVVRGNKILMGDNDVIIEPNDRVIIFLVDKQKAGQVERLFETEGMHHI